MVAAQLFAQVVGAHVIGGDSEAVSGQTFHRVGASSHLRRILDDLQASIEFSEFVFESVRPLAEALFGGSEHANDGDEFADVLGATVNLEGAFEGGEDEFIGAHGAVEGMFANEVEGFFEADDEAGLGAAEELVAGEADDVGAGGEAVLDQGLVGESVGGEVEEGAGAEVVHDEDVMFVSEGDEFGDGNFGGEADDAEVGGVDTEDESSVFGDGVFIVAEVDFIGGADFDEFGAGFFEDVGDAEAAADFDELTAGDDDFFAFGEGAEADHGGSGVVVDDGGGGGAGEFLEEGCDAVFAAVALT